MHLLDFFFPRYCTLCGNRLSHHEQHICLPCYMHLPRTEYHAVEHSNMEKMFWGQVPIERAVSFIHYTDSTKEILLQVKYKSNPLLGTYLISQYTKEIRDSHFFEGIDFIVPIPLHWIRRMKRHYNQSHYLAQGICAETGIPIYTKAVRRKVNNVSQTTLRRSERQDNVEGIFRLQHPEPLQGKHILLIDDVMTTGATLISCMKELAKIPDIKISVLTLCVAGHSINPENNHENFPYIPIDTKDLSQL